MSDDEDIAPMIPVSPSTGLDPEIRQFMSRLMMGYESAHRQIGDLCTTLSKRAEQAESMVARSLEIQIKLAKEREELTSQRHRRELEAEMAKQKTEAIGELKGELRSLLVVAGKKWLGVPLTGNDSHGLQDLLKSFSNEQIENLMTSGQVQLSVAQRHLLASTLSSLAESEAKKSLPEPQPEAAE